MPFQLFFDRQDREILRMINEIIDNGPSCDLEHRIFNSSLHPHGILNLTTSHAYRMAHAVINLLGSLSNSSKPSDRLAALASLREEVLHSAMSTFRYNTGRVLIQIMKSIIRSRDNESEQIKLVHDFRKVASGNPRIVRDFLNQHHLLEMPEEWNQLTLDQHVHDANTKGRKNATFLIMDAWIKGIRNLTVVYYNYVEPEAAAELLQAAAIMRIEVRIGLEFKARFRDRYVSIVWTPRGFSDAQGFLDFITDYPVADFMAEAHKVSLWQQDQVLRTLDAWNEIHAPVLAKDFGIVPPHLDKKEFLAFVDKGQTSLLHLAEFAHRSIMPALKARVDELEKQIASCGNADACITLNDEIHALDMLTPTAILTKHLAPARNPGLPSPDIPADDDRPEMLRSSVGEILQRLTTLRTGYRMTLQLAGLTAEDVLEILWEGQGAITHLELFNMKEWQENHLTHIEEINELQLALNRGDVMHLKHLLRGMEQQLELSDAPDANDRRMKIVQIMGSIRTLQSLYRASPLGTQIGTDSTSHLGNRYGMGLAMPETLPRNARRQLACSKFIHSLTLPVHISLNFRDNWTDDTRTIAGKSKFKRVLRAKLGLLKLGMRCKREWRADMENASFSRNGNVITMGGIIADADNGLTSASEAAPVHDKAPGGAYLNTTLANLLKVLFGFLPAMLTFMNTQHWWVLAFFGAPIWFGITGIRNIIQAVIAGGSSRRTMLSWKGFVNWSRICDSLMYTGFSVILLEGITRGLVLDKMLGLTIQNHPLLVFTIIAIANGTYISSHNIYRGFPRSAIVGNFFRSILAIPVAVVYNNILGAVLPALLGMTASETQSVILIPAAAIVSKLASDTVAGVIESAADRRNNYRLRRRDYFSKLRNLFDCYTRLELAFPDADILAMLGKPKEFMALTSSTDEGHKLQVESFITVLDLMYFWYYQPCAQQIFQADLRIMTREERIVFARFQGILHNVQEICQLFVDGMLGTNFSKALSFYLDNHDDYIEIMTRRCARLDRHPKN